MVKLVNCRDRSSNDGSFVVGIFVWNDPVDRWISPARFRFIIPVCVRTIVQPLQVHQIFSTVYRTSHIDPYGSEDSNAFTCWHCLESNFTPRPPSRSPPLPSRLPPCLLFSLPSLVFGHSHHFFFFFFACISISLFFLYWLSASLICPADICIIASFYLLFATLTSFSFSCSLSEYSSLFLIHSTPSHSRDTWLSLASQLFYSSSYSTSWDSVIWA